MTGKYLNVIKKTTLPRIRSQIKGDNSYWLSVINNTGSELIKVIKNRGYSRGIFLVEHPSFGRCILKTSCPVRKPGKGLADMAIADIVKTSNPGIFPNIFDSTPSSIFEEYIDGKKFHLWLLTDYDHLAINNFFSALKSWSIECADDIHHEFMKSDEIRFLCNRYIEKCLGQLEYLPNKRKLKAAYMVLRQRKRMAKQVDWLWEAADGIQLSKSLMCGDMGTKNILADSQSNRLYNIDYEHMRIGHYGFDAAYFLSSYTANDPEAERFSELTELILTDDYLGGQECKRFFQILTDLLSEISRTVFRYYSK